MNATDTIACPACGGEMEVATKRDSNVALQVAGVLVFLIALGLLLAFPIGTVVGIVLMIGAARMGATKRRVRRCVRCGHFYEIA